MIFEWLFSFILAWFFPASLSVFNPFYLPISSYILKRKPFVACTGAYLIGIMRDIFLATPRFGLLGLSSLLSTFCAVGICFYFSLEGLAGSLALTTLLALCDILLTASLGSFFCGHFFFSWRALFFALLFSALWTLLMKGVPLLVYMFSLRRRRRNDTDS